MAIPHIFVTIPHIFVTAFAILAMFLLHFVFVLSSSPPADFVSAVYVCGLVNVAATHIQCTYNVFTHMSLSCRADQ